MAKLSIDIPHRLPQEEALQRIKNLLAETKRDHGDQVADLTENWEGNTGTFSFRLKGFDIAGTLTVTTSEVQLRGQIPFALSLFKGKITSMITGKANELLA